MPQHKTHLSHNSKSHLISPFKNTHIPRHCNSPRPVSPCHPTPHSEHVRLHLLLFHDTVSVQSNPLPTVPINSTLRTTLRQQALPFPTVHHVCTKCPTVTLALLPCASPSPPHLSSPFCPFYPTISFLPRNHKPTCTLHPSSCSNTYTNLYPFSFAFFCRRCTFPVCYAPYIMPSSTHFQVGSSCCVALRLALPTVRPHSNYTHLRPHSMRPYGLNKRAPSFTNGLSRSTNSQLATRLTNTLKCTRHY